MVCAILKKYRETSSILADKQKCEKILKLFDSNGDDEYVDLDHFADLWFTILIPELDKLRAIPARRRKIYTLRDLNFRTVIITAERLDWLLENCQYSSTLDEMVSACIISIAKSKIS